MIIRILPEAEHDLEIGADFYESQGNGLGRYFSSTQQHHQAITSQAAVGVGETVVGKLHQGIVAAGGELGVGQPAEGGIVLDSLVD